MEKANINASKRIYPNPCVSESLITVADRGFGKFSRLAAPGVAPGFLRAFLRQH